MPANVTVARGLQTGSDERALLLDLFSGQILEAFHKTNVFWDGNYVQRQDLQPGAKSHQFPLYGESPEDASYHVPGQFIDGGTITVAQSTVAVDDILVKALNIPFIDQALSRWDQIAPAANEIGRIMAENLDKKLAQLLLIAARTAAVSNVHAGGNTVQRTAATEAAAYPISATGSQNFQDDLATMAQLMDEDNIPETNRVCFVSPRTRNVLTKDTTVLMNRDLVRDGVSDITERAITRIQGYDIVLTQHLPTANLLTAGTGPAKYHADFSLAGAVGLPIAICCHNIQGLAGAVGAVQSGGFHNVIEPDEHRNVTFVKSQLLFGADTLAVWNAGEIRVKPA